MGGACQHGHPDAIEHCYVGKRNAMRTSVRIFTTAAVAAMSYRAWIDGLIGPSKIVSATKPLKDVLAVILF
jgi:hypothetical protein